MALAAVKDLDLFQDRVCELDACMLMFAIEEFGSRKVGCSTMSNTKASTSGRTGSMRSSAKDWQPFVSAWTIPSPGSSSTANHVGEAP